MRNFITAFCLLLSCTVFSQATFTPAITKGTKMHYQVITSDGEIPLVIKLDSTSAGYMKLVWTLGDGNEGGWIMKKNSIDKAEQGWWGQPEPNSNIDIPDNQLVAMFSKAQWNAIQKDKKTSFDMLTYVVKSPSEQQRFKLGEKEVDAIFLEGTNGSSRIWLLNNPSFPFILKIEGNTVGPDVVLKSID